jgi:hypothetical protein
MQDPNPARRQDQNFAGSAWVTNRDAQIAARITAERHQPGAPQVPLLPTAADPRAQRRGRRWRWARAAVFALFALARAARPKAGHRIYLAGLYVAGTVVFALLALHQSVRAVWTCVRPALSLAGPLVLGSLR